MFERFTPGAIKVIMLAQEEARRLGHNCVATEQILLGLIGEGKGIAARTLKSMGVNLKDARVDVERITGRGTGGIGYEISFTPGAKRVLELSWDEARKLGHNYIGTEHLLLALMRKLDDDVIPEAVAAKVLEDMAVGFAKMREQILTLIKEADLTKDLPEVAPNFQTAMSKNPRQWGTSVNAYQPQFQKFTEKAIKVVMLAQEEARRLGHNFVGTEQILLGLLGESTGIAAKTLKSTGVTLKEARVETEKIIGRASGFVAVEIPFTPRAKRVLELSWDEARQLGHNYIGTEHLLLGLIREGNGVAVRVLQVLGVDLVKMRGHVIQLLSEQPSVDTAAGANLANVKIVYSGGVDVSASGDPSKTPTLDQYCLNLSQAASDNKWKPIVGRQQEMDRIIQILGRHAKNSAILIGEAGVGKTAIARGLAAAIANDDVPEELLGRN